MNITASPSLHGLLVTYKRPECLAVSVRNLGLQSHPLARLLVIDNDPRASASVPSVLSNGTPVETIRMGFNAGPAGGLATGMSVLMYDASVRADDWLILLDDDDPPTQDDIFARLLDFAEACRRRDPKTACVGRWGATFDRRRGILERRATKTTTAFQAVDHIGGGSLPLYSVRAIRTVGTPRSDFFFGFEELEYGLRLGSQGWSIYAQERVSSASLPRLSLAEARRRRATPEPPWRIYYTQRNILVTAHEYGRASAVPYLLLRQAARLTIDLLLGGRRLRWQRAAAAIRGVRDGLLRRTGIRFSDV